jgi:16S rRNA processing protein RimM
MGMIVGIFGVKGEVRIHMHNRGTSLFREGRPVQLVAPDGSRQTVALRTRPGAGGRILGRIPGLDDREEARALIGYELILAKSDLPPPEPDEYYHHELLGLSVVTEDGRSLGTLAEIHDKGEVDIWLVRGDQEYYLPALAEVFLEVDVANGRAVVASDAVNT